MERILEPELMEDEEQVRAYAEADFGEPHGRFIELMAKRFGGGLSGYALDLGCGPGDITRRFAERFPDCFVDGVDGSKPMLDFGLQHVSPTLSHRIHFVHGRLPDVQLPRERYDVIFSNSLLHHLPEPKVLWGTVKRYAQRGTRVFIMDLTRPASRVEAKRLVDIYACDEPPILQRDFLHSLLSAFEPSEISGQLEEAGLGHLTVATVSDRHVIVFGRI